jgi:hypothetical protein
MNDELLDDKQQSINLLSAFDFLLEFATSIFLLFDNERKFRMPNEKGYIG